MTYHQYWEEDVCLVKAYRKAQKLRADEQNYNAWLQGRYVYDALLCVSPCFNPYNKRPQPIPFHDEPYPFTQEEYEAQQRRAEARKQAENERKLQEWAERFNANFAQDE